MEIVIQDSPGVFFIRLKSITGKYLETKVKTGMIEPLLKDQYPLFVLNHMIKFSQKVPLRYVTYPGIIFWLPCNISLFWYFQKYEIQPFRGLFCSNVFYLPNEMKWALTKPLAKSS